MIKNEHKYPLAEKWKSQGLNIGFDLVSVVEHLPGAFETLDNFSQEGAAWSTFFEMQVARYLVGKGLDVSLNVSLCNSPKKPDIYIKDFATYIEVKSLQTHKNTQIFLEKLHYCDPYFRIRLATHALTDLNTTKDIDKHLDTITKAISTHNWRVPYQYQMGSDFVCIERATEGSVLSVTSSNQYPNSMAIWNVIIQRTIMASKQLPESAFSIVVLNWAFYESIQYAVRQPLPKMQFDLPNHVEAIVLWAQDFDAISPMPKSQFLVLPPQKNEKLAFKIFGDTIWQKVIQL